MEEHERLEFHYIKLDFNENAFNKLIIKYLNK